MPDVYANCSCDSGEFSRHQRGSVQPILSARHVEFGVEQGFRVGALRIRLYSLCGMGRGIYSVIELNRFAVEKGDGFARYNL